MPMPEIEKSQNWLISRMRLLYYQSNSPGLCDAQKTLADQAMLLRLPGIKQFNDRLYLTAGLPDTYFKFRTSNVTPKVIPGVRLPSEEEWLDICAYFECLELLQNNYNVADKAKKRGFTTDYQGLFPTREEEKIPWTDVDRFTENYTTSIALKEQGGQAVVQAFFGEYTKENIQSMFEKFQKLAEDEKLKFPVCFSFDNAKHVITCSYQPGDGDERGKFYFFDANRCPIQEVGNLSELADKILSSESFGETPGFYCRMTSTAINQQQAAEIAEKWCLSDEWIAAHQGMDRDKFFSYDERFKHFSEVDKEKQPDLIRSMREHYDSFVVNQMLKQTLRDLSVDLDEKPSPKEDGNSVSGPETDLKKPNFYLGIFKPVDDSGKDTRIDPDNDNDNDNSKDPNTKKRKYF